MRAFQLLQWAGHTREQAERARRLATAATTATDVSDALLTYARQLDEQARQLEERAANCRRMRRGNAHRLDMKRTTPASASQTN